MDRSITIEKLLEVWDLYTDHRRGFITESTTVRDYAKIRKRILKMVPDSSALTNGPDVRDWLLDRYSPETARRTLMQLNAASSWGEFTRHLPANPFLNLTKYLTRRRVVTEDAYVGFSAPERDTIIAAFQEHDPFYLPWVKFMFYTGCRPEEAAALRWENVAHDFSQILIHQALPADVRILKETKSYKTTRFPCNDRLQHLLRSMKPYPKFSPSQWLFLGERGALFNYHNFQTRHWRPMVSRLAADGAISFYLPQGHARHTFITLALQHLDLKTVAYLCRVSEQVLVKHYLSRSRDVEIPEF
jgi:integrase